MRGPSENPFDGWITKYRVSRSVHESEIQARLDRKVGIHLPSIDKGVLRINSVFLEYIDRYFFLRGYAAVGGGVIAIFTLWASVMLFIVANKPLNSGELPPVAASIMVWFFSFLFLSMFFWVLKFALLREFFCYTYYPIRFNRNTRKVYIFLHKDKNGVLALDWNKVFWFIGRSRDGSHYIYDLRGHVLDDEKIVRYTFAVGHYGETQAEILQHWEMIRLYMEESPASLPYPPLALSLSTQPTLRNCLLIQMGWLNTSQSGAVFLLSVVWGFFRWLALKTCRQPRWPADIEAACQIPANDPYRQTEPLRAGEFPDFGEAEELRQSEYIREARAAAEAYEQARSKANAS
ncbi:DUF6708 domain-containing protein [Pseudomonas weihenstephanensis]|uniref:DUF6708 domain-containing protein n=1 Tax=Pseudomonas weihenstephanensis TaxID=1608994 RepID=UPI0006542BCC|nr:DUF6708 domain-containing protein [Pseudomonas weihenstephanensis]KMN16195.1 hypothetical protein TU87_22075 [Pseudomonas weihenstephanensis]MBM1189309.1 hypothetical protein [Pseudomonas weihenstephanensis]